MAVVSALDRCATAAGPDLGAALVSLATDPGSHVPIDDNSVAQLALFAIDWSLAQLWWSWGIEPVAAIGHSLGGVVAATLAGVLELEEAIAMVAVRGRLVQEHGGRDGGMVALSLRWPRWPTTSHTTITTFRTACARDCSRSMT